MDIIDEEKRDFWEREYMEKKKDRWSTLKLMTNFVIISHSLLRDRGIIWVESAQKLN